ncbi:MAG: hypothetical protein ABIG63_21050, partial [Chloroflexota bacterium]
MTPATIEMAMGNEILNQIVGSYYMPGGHRGQTLVGPSWNFQPRVTDDGLVSPSTHEGAEHPDFYNLKIKKPETYDLKDLFPLSTNLSPVYMVARADPEKFKLPYEPEILINSRRNVFLSGSNWEQVEEVIKKYRFVVVFSAHINEMAEMADLVFPEAHNLEKKTRLTAQMKGGIAGLTGYNWAGFKEPAQVPPLGEAGEWEWVMHEMAKRIGYLGGFYEEVNKQLKEPYKLDTSKVYSIEEIQDRRAKSILKSTPGEERGLEWLKDNGCWSRKMTADEMYPLPWLKVRFPMYFENMLDTGTEIQKVAQSIGIKDWDTSGYKALPEWKPCPVYDEREVGDFDLVAFNFRVAYHSFSHTNQNAWLAEIAE